MECLPLKKTNNREKVALKTKMSTFIKGLLDEGEALYARAGVTQHGPGQSFHCCPPGKYCCGRNAKTNPLNPNKK